MYGGGYHLASVATVTLDSHMGHPRSNARVTVRVDVAVATANMKRDARIGHLAMRTFLSHQGRDVNTQNGHLVLIGPQ